MSRLDVVVVGSSPWRVDLADDHNLTLMRALAGRLDGRFDVIVPAGAASPGELALGPVRLHRLATRTRPGFALAARRRVDQVVAQCAQRTAAGTPLVLVSSDPLAAVAVECSFSRRRLPHVLHIQGEIIKPGPEYGGRLKRWALATVTKAAVRRATAVRVVSRHLATLVTPLTKAPVAVIGARVDTRTFTPARTPVAPSATLGAALAGEPVAVMVGSLLKVKNHDTVLRAWACVLDAMPAARLQIVGDGSGRPRIEALIDELGLRHRVRLLGWLPHTEVAAVLARSTCMLHPSWSEGHPRAVLEGMACGLPVICSDIPTHRELVTPDVGALVAPADIAGWTAAITDVLSDRAHATERGRAARRLVERGYDFDTNVDQVAALISGVAAGEANGLTAR